MKHKNCPTCNKRFSGYNETVLDLALSQHIAREHEEHPAEEPFPYFTDEPAFTDGPFDDFSRSGLGIGGLGSYQEPPFIPTVAQMERMDQMEASATTCRKCGESDVMDGAMFSTDRSSGLCDDCY